MSLKYGFALRPTDNSADFSNAMQAVFGDGITVEGGHFGLTINGFTATLSSGYALAAGRWAQNDEPLALRIVAPGNNDDRTDALVAHVNYEARAVALEVLIDVDPDKLLNSLRGDGKYSIVLYLIRVRRGVTSLAPDDVTDLRDDEALCGRVIPLSAIAGDVLYIYQFLISGIDQEVARLIELSEQVVQKADTAIAELDKSIKKASGCAGIGELITSRHPPSESGWLICDGGDVPAEYPALSALLDGILPNISQSTDRYQTYIYGGAPVEV